ncbi:glycosyltransferase family 8 protein [Paracoccus benzoatiresistens]|uniref:Glycosyltransferase n=1 Tax=Paracoccus benzoatiresistens TaxID=2997341 RepID=A0ABT4J869_9RHOB|nr:glycosyltransferase [Paracoccus sp. EF6]MCZ0963298.1 glycosyltransferase [Paracoccus sp. EF6]
MSECVFLPGWAPRHDCAVIVACDGNYLPYAAVVALQMARAAPACDLLIGSPDPLDLPDVLRAAGIGHVAARLPLIEDALPLDDRRSLATYMDVFLASALAGVYRRILVLDADILHERGDPARLLAADMRGHAVAAVRDNRQWRNPSKRVPDFRRLGWSAAPYFNAGVVMIDTAAWAAQDLPARCAGFARQHLKGLGRDQALLNGTLHGDWAEISPLWNWQFTWASSLLSGMADPCLVHFIGPAKPWQDRSAGIVPMRWRAPYGAFLARHFPDALRPAEADRRHWPARRELGRSLLRQWRAAGPTLDYLARFADEYTLVEPR